MPAITHWQSPRFFAYFANTGSEPGDPRRAAHRRAEPGRDPLAHLAGAAGARGGDARLARAAARAPGRPARPHRGHGLDVHDGRARRGAARRSPARRAVVCLRARALVGREGGRLLELEVRPVPVDDAFRMRAGRARPRRTPARSSRRSGRPRRPRSTRSPRSRTRARRPASGCTSTPRTRAPPRSAPSCAAHFAGWERADSIVVNPHKWLLTPMDCSALWTRRPDDLRARLQPRPGVPARQRGRGEPPEYSPVLGRRFRALKLWAVLRCYGRDGLQALIREHVRLAGAVRGLGARRAGLGGRGAAAVLARLLPPRRRPTRRTRRCSSASTRPARSSSRTRS